MQTSLQLDVSPGFDAPSMAKAIPYGGLRSHPLLAIFIDSGVMVALLAVLSGLALTVEVARLRLPA